MADPTTATDPDLEFLKSISPIHQPDASDTAPLSAVGAPSSWLPSGDLDVGREIGMGATQFGIGALGLPAAIGRGAMWAGHKLAPSLVGETPDWMYPEGPGGYGNALTDWSGYRPANEAERIYAQGMRGAGSGAYFGPMGAVISGVGSGIGQGITDLGYPGVGRGVEMASGLASGYRGATALWDRIAASRAAAPTAVEAGAAAPATAETVDASDLLADESNVIPFPNPRAGGPAPAAAPRAAPAPAAAPAAEPALTPRQLRAEQREEIIATNVARDREISEGNRLITTWGPMYRWAPGILKTPINAYLFRRGAAIGQAAAASPVATAATNTARRILGLGAGTIGSALQATQQIPPRGMSFSYNPPDQPTQAGSPFLRQPLQIMPQRTDQQYPDQQTSLGGWLR